MGLGQSNSVKYTFGRDGKVFLGSDKDMQNPYDYVEGYVSKISFKDSEFTHEGKTIKKRLLSVNLKDGDDTYNIQIDIKSRGYATVVGQLLNADLGKVIRFIAKGRDLPSGKVATDFILGDGLKSAFSKENGRYELPRWKEVEIDGEKRYDRKEYLDKIEEILTREVISKMPDEQVNDVNHSSNEPEDKTDDTQNVDESEDLDELPF